MLGGFALEVARLTTTFDTKGVPGVLSDTARVEGALNHVGDAGEQSAGRIGNAFMGIAKKAAFSLTALAAVAGAFIAKGVMADAAAEQMRNSLETVTGSVARANELFTELQKFAAATPFEFPELVQASINLEAFGLKTEDWINTVGDTASAMGKSVDQVTQAVLDAATGQYERLKELGISAGVEGDKLVIRYMKNGKQITESVDKTNKDIILKTIQGIWNDKYKGAMVKQSKTFLGQWSTLKDNFNMTLQKMAMPFFDFTKKILAEGNQFFNLFNKKMAAGLDPVHAALSALHVTLDQVFGKQAGDLIDGTLRGIVDGIGAVVGAISGLAGSLASGDISGFFSQLGGDLSALASKGFEIPKIAVKVLEWGFDQATDLYESLKTHVEYWATGGPSELRSLSGGSSGGTGSMSLGTVAVAVADWAVSQAVDLAGAIGGKIDEWWGTVKSTAHDLGTAAVKITSWSIGALSDLGTSLGLAIGGMWRQVKETAHDLGTALVKITSWSFSQAVDLGAALALKVSGLWGGIKDTVRDLGTQAVKILAWTFSTAVDLGAALDLKIQGWWGTAKDTARDLGTVAVNVTGIAVKEISGWASDALSTIQTWVDSNPPGSIVTAIQLSDFSVAFAEGASGNWGTAVSDLLVADPIKVTPVIELNITQAVQDWTHEAVTNPPDWGDLGTAALVAGLAVALFVGWPEALAGYFLVTVGPDIVRVLNAAVAGFLQEALLPKTTFEKTGPFGEFVPTETPGFGQQWSDNILGWFQTMADDITKKIGDLDLFGGVISWLQGKVDDLTSWIGGLKPPDLPQWITDPLGWIASQMPGSGDNTGHGSAGGGDPHPRMGTVLGDVAKSMGRDIGTGGGGGFNLDFTATFTADTQGVSDGFQMARAIGQAWDISVFPAAFTADIANVQDQANFAWSIGNQWAGQVFTASFAIDTSGLQAASDAADAVAAHIAAVMPHSPAREGPLREPISFDYIADSMRSAMSRVARYAGAGAAAVAGIGGYIPLGTTGTGYSYVSRTGHGRYGTAPQVVHNHYYELPEFMARDALAFVRQEVATGVAKEVPRHVSRQQQAGR